MKKAIFRLLALVMAVGLLAACGEKKPPEAKPAEPADTENKTIETLRIAFVPSHDPQGTLTAAEPLKAMLQTELAASGYEVKNVELSVGESYDAVGEALASGAADVGIGMPGGTYVLYDGVCDVILTALRNGLSKDSDEAKDWNDEMPTVAIDQQAAFYRALFIAGPSDTGRTLAAKVNAGQALTWEELDAATWSVMGKSSSAGYIYPSLWLREHYGKSVADLSHTVQADSYDEAFARLASGEVDALLCYADARTDYAVDWEGKLGRPVTIWEETSVIGVTSGIYNDTVTVGKASAIMSEGFVAALQDAFIRIGETEAGRAAVAAYNHKGYQKAVAADYDNARAAQELMEQTK